MNLVIAFILHFGSEKDTIVCLKSIFKYNYVDIVIIDNDPEQKLQLPNEYSNVSIIRTGGKLGFASAFNFAVHKKRKHYHQLLLILNNDMILTNDALSNLCSCMVDHDIGAIGPCIPYAKYPSGIWACGGKIDKIFLNIGGVMPSGSKNPYEVDYLPGAAILISFNAWDKVGGLPEKYFLAFEEAEFALRIKRMGLKIMVNPNSIILHQVGMSSDRQPMYIYNSIRNRIRFSKYLYGEITGILWGVLVTMDQLRRKKNFFFGSEYGLNQLKMKLMVIH